MTTKRLTRAECRLTEVGANTGRNAYYHVAPKYCCGSPAMVTLGTCIAVAIDEEDARATKLTGVQGEDWKRRAETEGLGGIAYARWEKGGKVWRYDLLTRERFVEPKRLTYDEKQHVLSLRNRKQYIGLTRELEAELAALEYRLTIHREKA
jgi:hypothetical protein